MSFDEQAARDFLGKREFDEDKAKQFLAGKSQPLDKEEEELENYLSTATPSNKTPSKSLMDYAGEFSNAANAVILDTLGLPSTALQWAVDKAGINADIPFTGDDLREIGQKTGVSYGKGEIPDTPATRAGKYTALGLEFLVPVLRLGKGAEQAVKAGGSVVPSASTFRGVMQKITSPFITNPYTATATEITGSIGSGVGSYYGEREFGQVGEILGGIAGGLVSIPAAMVSPYVNRYIHKNVLTFSKIGGKIKASNRLHQLAETPDVDQTIIREQGKVLADADFSPAKLSRDRHLIALENEILKQDPELAHKFILTEFKNNKLAIEEIKDLGGDIPITETQTYMKAKVNHIKELVNRKVDKALQKAYESLSNVASSTQRKVVNTTVKAQLDDALEKARGVEKDAWNKVKQDSIVPTVTAKAAFKNEVMERAEAADPSDIPEFLYKYLGHKTKDGFKQGKWGDTQTIKEMQALRSRVLDEIRVEKAKDAPNWNKVRIMDDVQESLLEDMSSSTEAGAVHAITVSRDLNERFKGDIMDIIFNHKRSGGKIAPELSLSTIKSGPKAAVAIKKVINASPESKPMLEELVKLNLSQSKAINTKTGRVNVPMAKRYMLENEDVFDLFPELKKQMDNAIGLEERAIGTKESAKFRLDKVTGSSFNKIAEAKPGSVWNEIITSKNPVLTMRKVIERSNAIGQRGVKNDVMNYLFKKSRTGQLDDAGIPILSGRKFKNELKTNLALYKEAFKSKEEFHRLNQIAETLAINEGYSKLPEVGAIMSPKQGIIAYGIVTVATRAGAVLGHGTSGASLRTASMASKVAQKFIDKLDVGMAQKLLTDAVDDVELYNSIFTDTTKPQKLNQVMKVLHGWMIAHSIESLEEDNGN